LVRDNSRVPSTPQIPDVLAARYASAKLTRIWSPEHKVVLERRLWLAVLVAQRDLGVDVPDGVENGLDVVAVGIEQEGSVIAGMIVGPHAWRTIVLAPGRQPPRMERFDHRAIRRLESEVDSPSQLAVGGLAVGGRDDELVGPEEALALAADRDAEHVQHRFIEAPARRQVRDHQLDVIDQAAAVQFHVISSGLKP
jgi:hypothetical protein